MHQPEPQLRSLRPPPLSLRATAPAVATIQPRSDLGSAVRAKALFKCHFRCAQPHQLLLPYSHDQTLAVQSSPKHSSNVALFFLSSCFDVMCSCSPAILVVPLNVCVGSGAVAAIRARVREDAGVLTPVTDVLKVQGWCDEQSVCVAVCIACGTPAYTWRT